VIFATNVFKTEKSGCLCLKNTRNMFLHLEFVSVDQLTVVIAVECRSPTCIMPLLMAASGALGSSPMVACTAMSA